MGLNNSRKRCMLLNSFRQMNFKILLILEIPLVLESEPIFQSEWGNSSALFSHGTKN